MKKNSKLLFLILVIIVSLPSIIGLLHLGFPSTDDGNWMVIRFSAFFENLRNGQFPVRFLTRLNYGFGYPVADFLYPLFMYLGIPIHILGFSFVNTIKILFALSMIFSSVFSYLWLSKRFDNVSSLVGSAAYTFFPYHLFDLYQRGSLGEVLALSIVPFILWQVERKSLLFTSLGIAFLVLSHNSLALLFMPIIFAYIYFFQKKLIKQNILSFIFGFLISAFFWMPAFYDKQFTVFDNVAVSDFSKYFISFNNWNILGLAFIFLVLESTLFVFRKKDKNVIYVLLLTVFLTFLVLPISKTLWTYLPFTNLIQFPFRIVSVIMLLSSFLISYQLNKTEKKKKLWLTGIYLILIFISAVPFLVPKNYQNYPDSFYSTNQDTTTVKNEYMPKWVKVIPAAMPSEKVTVIKGQGTVENLFANGNKVTFSINALNEAQVQFNTVYFPGWKVKVDGKEVPISYENENGLIRFFINPGRHFINLSFGETPLRILADLVSFVSLIILFLLAIKNRRVFRK